jgi:hypothetical protein
MSGPRDFDEAEQWIRQDSNDIGRLEAENAQLRRELDEARAYIAEINSDVFVAALANAIVKKLEEAAKKD